MRKITFSNEEIRVLANVLPGVVPDDADMLKMMKRHRRGPGLERAKEAYHSMCTKILASYSSLTRGSKK